MVVNVAISGLPLHRTFSYLCKYAVQIGARVLVDFRGRRTTAYVLETSELPPEGIKLKSVINVIDPEPLINEADVRVAVETSKAFLTPIGKVFDLYFGGHGEFSTIYAVDSTKSETNKRQVLKKWLLSHGVEGARELVSNGFATIESDQKAKSSSRKFSEYVELIASMNEIADLKLGKNQLMVINYLSMKPKEELKVLLARLGIDRKTIESLEKKKLVRLEKIGVSSWIEKKEVTLTDEQLKVKESIEKDINSQHLLLGVTGSGKTEVYFELIEDLISQGRSALLLVPEISLTPQTIARVKGRFPEANVYPYHSNLTKRERAIVWWKAVLGEPRMIIVGTRSALWIPFYKLGIIVIDEEHDESYYQTTEPCYDAAVVAKIKSKIYGIPLILSSATPSLSTYYAAIKGELKLHNLKTRPVGSMPKVKVIDMRRKGPGERIISHELQRVLEATFNTGKVALILAMRKAFANYLACTNCGYIFRCPSCDVGLSYHRSTHTLKCHHCGFVHPVPAVCPLCGSKELKARGYGTERVEYELIKRFPAAKIVRFDRENVTSPAETERLIKDIVEGKSDFVVGTRLISKGLDAPNVNLVAVIDADRNLSIPSFTARESLFQLLVQMSGRSGRRESGISLIQTLEPEDEFFRFVKQNDYEAFAQFELEKRRLFHYPPYTTLIRIVASSSDPFIARKALEDLLDGIPQPGSGVELLGPIEAPIPKLKGEYRFHIMLKLEKELFPEISATIADLMDKIEGAKVKLNCYVNPRSTFP
ncbi:MAG: hypothetical protein PWP09_1595 [Thermotogota bacterium]|nr:hypothetical protein [Thermotogota bacterium]